jgi:formylglycine-generating enzyme required for sulfatase activity/uncharacterized caspase-like protein
MRKLGEHGVIPHDPGTFSVEACMSVLSIGMSCVMAALAVLAPVPARAQNPVPERAVQVRAGKPQPTGREIRAALVIGNSAYLDAPLRNPVNDARAMRTALEACGFEVTLLTDVDKRAMEDAIRAFGDRIRSGAVGLFYFAGHGLQAEGSNFLIPVGARLGQESDIRYEGVDLGRVLDTMKAAGNKLNILILDACRNNPFALAKGWRDVGERGLAQVKAPTGTLVAYATAPGATAADGSGDNGLYTGAILLQLKEPGVSLLQTFQRVREQVLAGSQGAQTPWESNSTVGDFFFRPQRSQEEIARDQAAVEAEIQRLEAVLRARQDQAQAGEAALLRERIRAQELERSRLLKEETDRQDLEAAQAAEARRQAERARLEALRRELAAAPGMATLDAARLEVERLTRLREETLKPIQVLKAQALQRLDHDFADARKRLEAPRDEFETTAQYELRMKQAEDLRANLKLERAALEAQCQAESASQVKPVDDQIRALREQKFPVRFPVRPGPYDPDQGRFTVLMPSGPRGYQASLALEPARAKALKARMDLVQAEGDVTLADGRGLPARLVDPVWGALPLEQVLETGDADLGRGLRLELVRIPAGSFRMGRDATDPELLYHALAARETAVADFWLGKYPVTQAQWRAVMGSAPSGFKNAGPDAPVEQVSWDDAQAFIKLLNRLQTPWTFRLPTEAEWEYACRAGGADETYGSLDAIAWFGANSGGRTHPVGEKRPNAFGLFDMLGNTWQWCQEWWSDDFPGPSGPTHGPSRVIRGGSWNSNGMEVRAVIRYALAPAHRINDVGFRVAASAR